MVSRFHTFNDLGDFFTSRGLQANAELPDFNTTGYWNTPTSLQLPKP
jgi:hypothetical protein